MPKSKKRPKAVAKQRQEERQQQESAQQPLQFSLPALRSPELNKVLAGREGWERAAELLWLMDSWVYLPSVPDGWDESYDGGGTCVTPAEGGCFEVVPPSFDDKISEFQRTYASVQDLLQDIEAIEKWRHPLVGAPRL